VPGFRSRIQRTFAQTSSPSASALAELLLGLAGAFQGRGRNARLQLGVEHDLHHPIIHAEYEHARMKAPVFDLGGDFEEGQRSGRYGAGQNHVGRDRVLIAKRAEGVGVRLSAATDQKLAWISLLERRTFFGQSEYRAILKSTLRVPADRAETG